VKTIYRVEVIVYRIGVDESGDEDVRDVVFEEDIVDTEDEFGAVTLAEHLMALGKERV
jgi:hypothetical protein